ncbi:uncharacterized protein LOC115677549 [Syzygium oleosum]|uniref:uncharacterized protein LOC115677549 n=1 Tax=Syzygium oleosum TaxID=219896 RepID=UPI0024BAA8CD|nr:uncharacterized protein LOC115677549 [Syzygium oleosum]
MAGDRPLAMVSLSGSDKGATFAQAATFEPLPEATRAASSDMAMAAHTQSARVKPLPAMPLPALAYAPEPSVAEPNLEPEESQAGFDQMDVDLGTVPKEEPEEEELEEEPEKEPEEEPEEEPDEESGEEERIEFPLESGDDDNPIEIECFISGCVGSATSWDVAIFDHRGASGPEDGLDEFGLVRGFDVPFDGVGDWDPSAIPPPDSKMTSHETSLAQSGHQPAPAAPEPSVAEPDLEPEESQAGFDLMDIDLGAMLEEELEEEEPEEEPEKESEEEPEEELYEESEEDERIEVPLETGDEDNRIEIEADSESSEDRVA